MKGCRRGTDSVAQPTDSKSIQRNLKNRIMCVFFEFGLGYRMKYLLLANVFEFLRRPVDEEGVTGLFESYLAKCLKAFIGKESRIYYFFNDILFEIYDG